MANWIVSQKNNLKIKAVVHMGDQVLVADDIRWARADRLIDTVKASGIPYMAVPGNHDYESSLEARPLTRYNLRHSTQGTGLYEIGHGENFYYLFSSGGVDFIIIGLEFGPRQALVDWANNLLTSYAERKAIIATHSYLYTDGTTTSTGDDWNPHTLVGGEGVHDGDELWTELISQHDNIIQVWSGHQTGVFPRIAYSSAGNLVTQILNAHGNVDSHLCIAQYFLANNRVVITNYLPATGVVLGRYELDIE